MISDVDLVVAAPTADVATSARPDGLAWVVGMLFFGTVVAVDPAGLVPTGPLRWTVITVTAGLVLAVLVRRTVAIPLAMSAVWVALIGVLLVATVRAVDPLDAWIGTPDRRLGLLAWLMFPALFLAGHACRSRAAARVVVRAGSVGAVVLGLWSVAEVLGHSPLGLEFANGRAGGPFGQPAYLGAACVLFGPLGVATALEDNETRGWRCAGAFGAGGAVFALAASQTRGAWVGAVVAGVAVAVRKRGVLGRHRRRVVAAAVALAVVAVVVGVTTPLGARAVSTFDLHHGTSASRFGEWRIATRTIVDHPLLGVGPEGYRVVFPQEVDAAYVRDYGDAVYTDRAHNGILDVTLDGGLLAGACYLALLVLAVRHAWRAIATHDLVAVALGAAVIAYVVQQQFLFPLAELDPIFWVLVGMLVVRTPGSARHTTLRARWLVGPIVMVTAAALFYGVRDVLADQAMKRAATTANVGTALREADEATRLRPDSIRTWYVAAQVAQRGEALTDVDAALARVVQGLDRSPRDPALRDLYGELLVERAARSRLGDDIALARRELGRLVADAPHDPMLHQDQVTAESLREIGKP